MSYSKFKNLAALGIGTVVAGTLYYVDYNNVLSNICDEKHEKIPVGKWDYNWDKRDQRSLTKVVNNSTDLEKPKPNRVNRNYILVRHGQYNLKGKTDNERYLTDLGRLQAEATGMRLSELALPNLSIVKSTMKRAQETSQLIESYLPPVPVTSDPLLEEGSPIMPEPSPGQWRPELSYYRDGPRIEAAFRKYFHRASSSEQEDSHTIIVCHANVIRYFICRALQFPPEGWLRMSLNHASITWITIYHDGRVCLRSTGESGHLLPEWMSR